MTGRIVRLVVVLCALTGAATASPVSIGATLRDVTAGPGVQGVLIVQVAFGGPFDHAGLRQHDIIVAVDQRAIRHVADLRAYLAAMKYPLAALQVTVLRYQRGPAASPDSYRVHHALVILGLPPAPDSTAGPPAIDVTGGAASGSE